MGARSMADTRHFGFKSNGGGYMCAIGNGRLTNQSIANWKVDGSSRLKAGTRLNPSWLTPFVSFSALLNQQANGWLFVHVRASLLVENVLYDQGAYQYNGIVQKYKIMSELQEAIIGRIKMFTSIRYKIRSCPPKHSGVGTISWIS